MNKHTSIQTKTSQNLIGEASHRYFIEIQAAYGFAQRGGVKLPLYHGNHSQRLVSDINLLNSRERKQLIFSEIIFSN